MSVSDLLSMFLSSKGGGQQSAGMASPGSAPAPINGASFSGMDAKRVAPAAPQSQFLVSNLMEQNQPKKSGGL